MLVNLSYLNSSIGITVTQLNTMPPKMVTQCFKHATLGKFSKWQQFI